MSEQGEQVVLEEQIDPNYVPSDAEVEEYARWLGMDMEADAHLLWIAKEGLKAPLPEDWKPCKSPDGEIYYFNFSTGESVWDHPCDEYYRKLYEDEKQRRRLAKTEGDRKRAAKQQDRERQSVSSVTGGGGASGNAPGGSLNKLKPLGSVSGPDRAIAPAAASSREREDATKDSYKSGSKVGGKATKVGRGGSDLESSGDFDSDMPMSASSCRIVPWSARAYPRFRSSQ